MITFEKASNLTDFKQIETLAHTIWHEHYIKIIGAAQVDYMLQKFQTAEAISEQINNGFEYFLIKSEDVPIGYLSFKKETETLFLSKIYILKAYRGKKIGRQAIDFVENKAKVYRLKSITLTVNKNNIEAIQAYQKMGFKNKGTLVIDIGNGFVMDDYQMVKKVSK